MAIHDHEFPTRPATYDEFRWRVQYLAELGIGRLLRREHQSEQEAADALLGKLS